MFKKENVFFSLHSVPQRLIQLFQVKNQSNAELTYKSLPLLFAYETEMKEVHNKLSVCSHGTFLCIYIMRVKKNIPLT